MKEYWIKNPEKTPIKILDSYNKSRKNRKIT